MSKNSIIKALEQMSGAQLKYMRENNGKRDPALEKRIKAAQLRLKLAKAPKKRKLTIG